MSIDGPREIHDVVRKRENGRGSFDEALAYCRTLRGVGFPFAVVAVFDERHIRSGLTYLDTIRFLNSLSPLVKVQFVEALGDSASHPSVAAFDVAVGARQVIEAVDTIIARTTSAFVSPDSPHWLYDNNLFRFLCGLMYEKARPYLHACTASHLTTIFPSGDLTACYTFAERPELAYGTSTITATTLEQRRGEFQATHTWDYMARSGVSVPWYRGVVGDICVADMMNTSSKLESSPFYKMFQETAVSRILQHLPSIARDPYRLARVHYAVDHHRRITGEYTAKMQGPRAFSPE